MAALRLGGVGEVEVGGVEVGRRNRGAIWWRCGQVCVTLLSLETDGAERDVALNGKEGRLFQISNSPHVVRIASHFK